MKPNPYIEAALNLSAFNCPHCHIYAEQKWYYMQASAEPTGYGLQHQDEHFRVSHCQRCDASTIWLGNMLLYPDRGLTEMPNPDLPSDVCADYDEAASILTRSPRGAAALLRLGIQKLCKHLGQSGTNINDDIKALVERGLPPKVQEALDSVRVIGNEAVHPGELDLRDDRETASKLFKLVNFIAAKMISEPKEIDGIYNGLPDSKRKAIARRDSKADREDGGKTDDGRKLGQNPLV
jgi:hypothetical protein